MSVKSMINLIENERNVLLEMTEALTMQSSKNQKPFDCCGDPAQQIESAMQHFFRESAETLSRLQIIENGIRDLKARKGNSTPIIEGEVIIEKPSE